MRDSQASTDPLDARFAALYGTRRAILRRLAAGEASVNELAVPFKLSQPTVSKASKVLERASGLMAQARDAQRRPRRLLVQPLDDAAARLQGISKPGNTAIDHGRASARSC
jgi:DNA-binding transcriptional ArsR family regulator